MLKTLKSNWFAVLLFVILSVATLQQILTHNRVNVEDIRESADSVWVPQSLFTDQVTKGKERELLIYGEDLIAHTATYFGPKGSVLPISNGMNCQNCHLDAGARAWGNNFGAVYSNYPKFRERSGSVENIQKRVNDCFERSLNGKPIDTSGPEMLAISTYINWLGKQVPKGTKPYGSGLEVLPYLDRAASTQAGRKVYISKCQNCHGGNGEGQPGSDGKSFAIPPLWGEHSYNDGAGLYRLPNFAAFVRNNMPIGQASHTNPALSLEEAWDVAAYVNSQPRTHFDQSRDWPDISKKPVNFPFGPYADTFPEQQHKYGPYGPIELARTKVTQKH